MHETLFRRQVSILFALITRLFSIRRWLLKTIRHYSRLFITIRHYSHCSYYSLFATIRYSLFGFSRHPSQRLTIVSGKSKIYSPRQGYLSPGNSIVLVIAATLLFISVTIFCRFWGSFCWNSSTLPTDLFIFVTYALPQKFSLYHISTHVCKFAKLENYTTW